LKKITKQEKIGVKKKKLDRARAEKEEISLWLTKLSWTLEGTRKIGLSNITWRTTVEQNNANQLGWATWSNPRHVALDEVRWHS